MTDLIRYPGKVLVALSGGVDSTVAAGLLLEQGYSVVGVTLRFLPGLQADAVETAARKAAIELGIELQVIDCSAAFEQRVVQPFCCAYLAGSTPNPCIICNREFKFGYLLEVADTLGYDYLATGHYARILCSEGRLLLARGTDHHKDQSYFMFCVAATDLTRLIFPLGDMSKNQVRQTAQRFGLSAESNAESQDICFVPDNDYKRLVSARAARAGVDQEDCLGEIIPGEIVHVDGGVLAQHQGIYAYTVGQRRGLGIAWPEPLYVIRLDAQLNQVIVGEKEHLMRQKVLVRDVVWGVDVTFGVGIRVQCQIRYRQQGVDALVTPDTTGATIEFAAPQGGISPGQAAVFYCGDTLLGGGWIC
ncbi:MAG: tRNA 2-thiouridine(34) synthase MnmA [Desulfuromonadaceae bacterium]|nr:tRNA 2-thiouridine(34) synthase MnmA [Desulfuromonas sp.]MDY0184590.1 tRNA 2-thiouridine(34) synthase MnmA [Desulfuromonadaceae bacterium]